MSRKNEKNTKGKIITAAWDLFYEQGYDNTTVEEIIEKSGTSKGFYTLENKVFNLLDFLVSKRRIFVVAKINITLRKAFF